MISDSLALHICAWYEIDFKVLTV